MKSLDLSESFVIIIVELILADIESDSLDVCTLETIKYLKTRAAGRQIAKCVTVLLSKDEVEIFASHYIATEINTRYSLDMQYQDIARKDMNQIF